MDFRGRFLRSARFGKKVQTGMGDQAIEIRESSTEPWRICVNRKGIQGRGGWVSSGTTLRRSLPWRIDEDFVREMGGFRIGEERRK